MRHVLVISLCVACFCLTRLQAQEPTLMVRSGHGDPAPVTCMALSPDGKWLITAHADHHGFDSRFRLWDAFTGRPVRGFSGALGVRSVAFSADGKQVVAGGARVEVFDPTTGKIIHSGPDELRGGGASFCIMSCGVFR